VQLTLPRRYWQTRGTRPRILRHPGRVTKSLFATSSGVPERHEDVISDGGFPRPPLFSLSLSLSRSFKSRSHRETRSISRRARKCRRSQERTLLAAVIYGHERDARRRATRRAHERTRKFVHAPRIKRRTTRGFALPEGRISRLDAETGRTWPQLQNDVSSDRGLLFVEEERPGA